MKRHPDPPSNARRDAQASKGAVGNGSSGDKPAKPDFLVQGVNACNRAKVSQASSPPQPKSRETLQQNRLRGGTLRKAGTLRGGPANQKSSSSRLSPGDPRKNAASSSKRALDGASSGQVVPSDGSHNSLSSNGQRRNPANPSKRLSEVLCKHTSRSSRQLISVRHQDPNGGSGNSSNNGHRVNDIFKSPLPDHGKISAGRLSYLLVNIRKKHKEIEAKLTKLQRSARPSRAGGGGIGMLISLPQLKSIDDSMDVLRTEFHELLSALVKSADPSAGMPGKDNEEAQDAEQTKLALEASTEEGSKADDATGDLDTSSPRELHGGDSTAESSHDNCPDTASAELCENEGASQSGLSPDEENSSTDTDNDDVCSTKKLKLSLHVPYPGWSSSAHTSSDQTLESPESQTSQAASGFYNDASSFRSQRDRRSSTRLPATERPLLPVSTVPHRADPRVSSRPDNSGSNLAPAGPAQGDAESSEDEVENMAKVEESSTSSSHPEKAPVRPRFRPQNSQQICRDVDKVDPGPSGGQTAKNPRGGTETKENAHRLERPFHAPSDGKAEAGRLLQETGSNYPHREPSKHQQPCSKTSFSSVESVPARAHPQASDHHASVTGRGQGSSGSSTLNPSTDANVVEGYKPSCTASKRRQAPPAKAVQPQTQVKVTVVETSETARPQWFVDMNRRAVSSSSSESEDEPPIRQRRKGGSARPSDDLRRHMPPTESVQTKPKYRATTMETQEETQLRRFVSATRPSDSNASTTNVAAPAGTQRKSCREVRGQAPQESVQTPSRGRDTAAEVRGAEQPQWFLSMNRNAASTASKGDASLLLGDHLKENADQCLGDVSDNAKTQAQQSNDHRTDGKQPSRSKIPHWFRNVPKNADAAFAAGSNVHGAIHIDISGRQATEDGSGGGIAGHNCRGRRRHQGDYHEGVGGGNGVHADNCPCGRCHGDGGIGNAGGAKGGDFVSRRGDQCGGRDGDKAVDAVNGRGYDAGRRHTARASRGNTEATVNPENSPGYRHRNDNFNSPPDTSRHHPRAEGSDRSADTSSNFSPASVALPPWLQDHSHQRSKSTDNPRESLADSREVYRRTLITMQNAALNAERPGQNDRMTPSWMLELRRTNSPHGNVNGSNVAQTLRGDLCLPPIGDTNSISQSVCCANPLGHVKAEQMTKPSLTARNDSHPPSLKGKDDKANTTSLSRTMAETLHEDDSGVYPISHFTESTVSEEDDHSKQRRKSEVAASTSARGQKGPSGESDLFAFLRDSTALDYRVARVTIHEAYSPDPGGESEAEKRDTRSGTAHIDFHDHEVDIPSNGFLVDRLGTPELLLSEMQVKISIRNGEYHHPDPMQDDVSRFTQGRYPRFEESSHRVQCRNGAGPVFVDLSNNDNSSTALMEDDESRTPDVGRGAECYRNAAQPQSLGADNLTGSRERNHETRDSLDDSQLRRAKSLGSWATTHHDGHGGKRSNDPST